MALHGEAPHDVVLHNVVPLDGKVLHVGDVIHHDGDVRRCDDILRDDGALLHDVDDDGTLLRGEVLHGDDILHDKLEVIV